MTYLIVYLVERLNADVNGVHAHELTLRTGQGRIDIIDICSHMTDVVTYTCFGRGVSMHGLGIDLIVEVVCYARRRIFMLLGR